MKPGNRSAFFAGSGANSRSGVQPLKYEVEV